MATINNFYSNKYRCFYCLPTDLIISIDATSPTSLALLQWLTSISLSICCEWNKRIDLIHDIRITITRNHLISFRNKQEKHVVFCCINQVERRLNNRRRVNLHWIVHTLLIQEVWTYYELLQLCRLLNTD